MPSQRDHLARAVGAGLPVEVLLKLYLLELRYLAEFQQLTRMSSSERTAMVAAWEEWGRNERDTPPEGIGTATRVWAGVEPYLAGRGPEIERYLSVAATLRSDVRFGGYLGAEFRNITFPGERAAATLALLAYQVYEKYDRKLRAMAKTDLAQAIAFDIGTSPGQSDWAFNQWDGALGSVITINENAFTAAIRDGHSTGSPWITPIPAIGTVLIAALAIAGTHRRLAEYR